MKSLLFYPHLSSFVRADIDILGSLGTLQCVDLQQSKTKAAYLKMMLFIPWYILRQPKRTLCLTWFADYHAAVVVFWARFLGRKSVVFIGGYDAVHYPEFAYGIFHSPLRRFCGVYAMKHADLIIANHRALLSSDNRYYKPKGHPEGIYRLIPTLKTKALVVHNCITTPPPDAIPQARTKCVLTVGSTPRLQDFINKGFDLMLKAAANFTDWTFIFVGIDAKWNEQLESAYQLSTYPNVKRYHTTEHAEVLALMNDADIYAQPSISEGMPNALLEAMLYGCKPLGSNVAGIPTLIGNWGKIIYHRSSSELISALEELMSFRVDRSAMARDTAERFSVARREQGLREALQRLQ